MVEIAANAAKTMIIGDLRPASKDDVLEISSTTSAISAGFAAQLLNAQSIGAENTNSGNDLQDCTTRQGLAASGKTVLPHPLPDALPAGEIADLVQAATQPSVAGGDREDVLDRGTDAEVQPLPTEALPIAGAAAAQLAQMILAPASTRVVPDTSASRSPAPAQTTATARPTAMIVSPAHQAARADAPGPAAAEASTSKTRALPNEAKTTPSLPRLFPAPYAKTTSAPAPSPSRQVQPQLATNTRLPASKNSGSEKDPKPAPTAGFRPGNIFVPAPAAEPIRMALTVETASPEMPSSQTETSSAAHTPGLVMATPVRPKAPSNVAMAVRPLEEIVAGPVDELQSLRPPQVSKPVSGAISALATPVPTPATGSHAGERGQPVQVAGDIDAQVMGNGHIATGAVKQHAATAEVAEAHVNGRVHVASADPQSLEKAQATASMSAAHASHVASKEQIAQTIPEIAKAAQEIAPATLTPPLPSATSAAGTTTASSPMASTVERPIDFGTLVETIARARTDTQGAVGPVTVALAHAEFGKVSLRFQNDDDGMTVGMTSQDPGFAPAAAAASVAAASAGNSQASAGQQDNPRHEPSIRQQQAPMSDAGNAGAGNQGQQQGNAAQAGQGDSRAASAGRASSTDHGAKSTRDRAATATPRGTPRSGIFA